MLYCPGNAIHPQGFGVYCTSCGSGLRARGIVCRSCGSGLSILKESVSAVKPEGYCSQCGKKDFVLVDVPPDTCIFYEKWVSKILDPYIVGG